MQAGKGQREGSLWDAEGDDALVETDEEDDVIVLGDPSLVNTTAADADKVTFGSNATPPACWQARAVALHLGTIKLKH